MGIRLLSNGSNEDCDSESEAETTALSDSETDQNSVYSYDMDAE